MSTKRDLAGEIEAWIAREQSRADFCRSQIADLEKRAKQSDRRAATLRAMLNDTDWLNAPTADEDAGF